MPRNAHLPTWSMTASRARHGGSAFCSAWTRCALGAARSAHPPGLPHRRARAAPLSAGPVAADSLRAAVLQPERPGEEGVGVAVGADRAGPAAHDPPWNRGAAGGVHPAPGDAGPPAGRHDRGRDHPRGRAQARDPEGAKKGNQWYFGMKAPGVDGHDSVATTAGGVPQLLHGAETRVWGDAGYAGVARRPEHQGRVIDWQVALRPGQRRRLPPDSAAAQAEHARRRCGPRWPA